MKLYFTSVRFLRVASIAFGATLPYMHPASVIAGGRLIDHDGAYSTSGGRSGAFQQYVNRQPGMTQRSLYWQNARGGQGYRDTTNTWNRHAGTGTHDSSTTYANGKTSSSQGTITKTGPGDYDYTGTHTGVNGKTSEVSKTIDKTGKGTATVDTTITGPNGKTATKDANIDKTANGYTADSTITGPNGKTDTSDKTVTYTKNANGTDTRTATDVVTNPSGQSKTYSNTETYTQTSSK